MENGIFLYAANEGKLSWEDTYNQMAQEDDEWGDWQALDAESEIVVDQTRTLSKRRLIRKID